MEVGAAADINVYDTNTFFLLPFEAVSLKSFQH